MTEEKKYVIPTMDDIRKLPVDKKVDGIIIDVDIKTWREIIHPDKLDLFNKDGKDNRDQAMVVVTYEVEGFKRDAKYPHHEKPTSKSPLGRFMIKYDAYPKVGMKVIIDFDEESKPTLLVAK